MLCVFSDKCNINTLKQSALSQTIRIAQCTSCSPYQHTSHTPFYIEHTINTNNTTSLTSDTPHKCVGVTWGKTVDSYKHYITSTENSNYSPTSSCVPVGPYLSSDNLPVHFVVVQLQVDQVSSGQYIPDVDQLLSRGQVLWSIKY